MAALAAAALAIQPGTTESFESISRLPADWKLVEYRSGVSTARITRGHAADGKRFVRLNATQPNHTRLIVPAAVEPDSTYRASAMVRARGGQDVPAVLGLDGDAGAKTDPIPGNDQWQEREFYVRTGQATTISLVLSLGWFGNTVAGTADFDSLQLEKVDSAPAGASVAGAAAPEAASTLAKTTVTQGPNAAVLPLTAVLLILVAGCGGVLLRGRRAN